MQSSLIWRDAVFFKRSFSSCNCLSCLACAVQPRLLLLPAVKRLFGNTNAANQLGNRHPSFRFLQYRNNLLHAELFRLHAKSLPKGKFCRKLTLPLATFLWDPSNLNYYIFNTAAALSFTPYSVLSGPGKIPDTRNSFLKEIIYSSMIPDTLPFGKLASIERIS
ncbi:hypothetical protein C8R21_10611 [Nitrosospira multiformis]|uniref:Uncharacterized protein n=1 Tax=Nitrosospira multiformis TaxID=1231 RepID=A0A1I7IUV5_9PROT|nr:hypothetical protein C8R21_10611 [Nitrosospira multiformis]SFU76679.1 hypothetical protein SAMN05216417_12723 [Nitrosospira multiformis]